MKLVLTSAPVSLQERYGNMAAAGSTEPSFGLVCLAACARKAGHDVAIVEASAADLSVEACAAAILAHSPDVVGISSTTVGIPSSARPAGRLKESGRKLLILIGGCHASAIPDETLSECKAVDLAVIGEGEATLVEILQGYARTGLPPSGLAGTAERLEGGAVRINTPRELLRNLDELPLPAWDLLEGFPGSFRPSPARIRRWPCASVVLTRGCPNACTFCDRSVFGRGCRSYSPGRAVEIVKDLRDNYGVREILIEDDTFTMSRDHVMEFCRLMREGGVDVTWSCLGRADRVDRELLSAMRKAGCWHISYGIESGDEGILKSVKKNLTPAQVRSAVEASRAAGLRTKGFFIIGFPEETTATLEATRRFVRSLPLDDITVMQLTPFPGSEIYGKATQYGAFDRNWGRMNCLNTVFVPRGITESQMDLARRDILAAFYLRPSVLARQAAEMLRHPGLFLHKAKSLPALLGTVFSRRAG